MPDPARAALPRESKITVSQVIDWFTGLRHQYKCQASWVQRTRVMRLFAERQGARRVKDCRPVDLLNFVNEQETVKSPWTRRQWSATVLRAFNFAVRMGLLSCNPFRGAMLPKGENGREMREAEFRTLLRLSQPAFRRVLIFLRHTGCRLSEMRSIMPGDVQIESRCIVLQEHKTRQKTRMPRRIMLNRVALNLVKYLLPRSKPRLPLFLNMLGRPWTNGALNENMKRFRRRSGMSRDAKLYGLRHAFGTGAIVAGLPAATVSALMGHKDPIMLMRYVHLDDKTMYLQEAIEKAVRPRGWC